MKKSQNFIIPIDVYNRDVMVSIGETNEQLKLKLDKFDLDYGDYFDHEISKGRSTRFKGGQTLIRFREPKDACHNTIAHEIFHAVTCLLTWIGMPFDLETNDEAYAYLIGYLTEKIYEKIKL